MQKKLLFKNGYIFNFVYEIHDLYLIFWKESIYFCESPTKNMR